MNRSEAAQAPSFGSPANPGAGAEGAAGEAHGDREP